MTTSYTVINFFAYNIQLFLFSFNVGVAAGAIVLGKRNVYCITQNTEDAKANIQQMLNTISSKDL